jgi:putative ABC transport system permease protein
MLKVRISALDRKLARDLLRLWPQALAIAFVLAAGVATLILAIGAQSSLSATREAYYERHRFADVFAAVTRAPNGVADRIREISGVAAAETRIVKYALLDIAGMAEPATGVAISLPDQTAPLLNRVYIRSGRLPEAGRSGEIAVNESFAAAHGMDIGATFHAILNGRKRQLTIVGIALSPEYIYAIGPGDLMPDYRRFAVMWMSEKTLAGIFDLDGAFNSVSVKLRHGANEADIIRQLDDILARYGGAGAHGRGDQLSHAFLDAELKQLAALARVIPPIFLLVSAFLLNMTLGRLIALEREQIGLLKAIGYGRTDVAWHYLKLVLAIAIVGIVIGFGLGTWFGVSLTRLYGRFFQVPFLVFQRDLDTYLIAAAVSVLAATVGALRATRDVLQLEPAVAMQPPAPPRYKRLWGEGSAFFRNLSQMTLMSIRNLVHWPVRGFLTMFGLALSVALLVVSLFALDSVEYMIDTTFFRSERQQATLNFSDKRPIRVVQAVAQLPGVLRAEPVRSVSVRLRNGHLSRQVSILGKPGDAELSRSLDLSHEPIALPESGLLINRRMADVLKLRRGELVEVEVLDGQKRTRWVPVADVIESYFGLVALMRIDALNQMLDEGPVVNSVHISYDRNLEGPLFAAIKSTPAVASLALQRISLKRFRETLAENINMMTSVYIGLSVIVAFGIVYNSTRVQLSERGRDLASLRVLGFTQAEVARVLFTELALLCLIAQPLGWGLGWIFSWITIQSFSSDLYTTPMIIEQATYAKASVVALVAALLSVLLVRRRLNRLDMIAVLKTRE